MIAIRPAGRADIPDLVALDTIAAASPERRDAIAGWVVGGQCHVAVQAGQVAGYAALTTSFFHAPCVEMLMVAAAARRSGVGLALLRHCTTLVGDGEKLWSSTTRSHAPMQALFARAGFMPSGIVENLDEGDPELIYLYRG